MQRKDYYAILGIARDAQESEIKIAYRKLALKNHPDTNRDDPHAEDRFKEINEAYDVLSNWDKRNHYDLLRDSLTGSSPFRPSTFDRWNHPFETDSFSGFGCRGGGIGRALGRKRKTFRETGTRPAGFAPYQSDLHIHDLSLKSDEAFEGTERDIRLHIGQDTLVFTVSIPAGVENGTLLSFKRPVGENQEIELLFRVTIAE
ncbi:MAG: DnaJ domain-containing protein [Deltaproteobacteria bacterium]|nr:DnaJ domain-containing protein [Deltaproteobacteria bacterium]